MSRAARRASKPSARSRRTPVRPQAGGRSLPIVPFVVLVGIVGIVGLIAYLVWQGTQPAKNHFDAAARTEADPGVGLPGVYVNLPKVYDGFYGNNDGNNTNAHVTRDVDYVHDCAKNDPTVCNSNPPAGGPHWGQGACPDDPATAPLYCGPVPWGIYRTPWPVASVVHNMEHGGMVIWYNTKNQQVIDQLESLVKSEFKGSQQQLMVLTPDPGMDSESVAITAWARIDKMPVSQFSTDRIKTFINAFKCRFNPENLSGVGC